jgi:hypothetical protein
MRKFFKPLAATVTALGLIWAAPHAAAFCGFYVAKADANLFNEASKVVMVRDGNRTVITMVNDYQGDPTEFAMVIPTPVVLQESQINIGKKSTVDHLDAYTAPRLVEYHDPDPCRKPELRVMRKSAGQLEFAMAPMAMADEAESLGVTIEAEYTIGEYDIVILSATQSDGLQTWLDREGYKVPPKARSVLASYIAQDMKFFVAKVNLEERAKIGGEFLRPIQLAFEHDRFMLPIRLGTVNAKDKQDLILYTLTRKGRVESTNYRTAKIPTDMDLPLFLKSDEEFGKFYKAMYAKTAEREGPSTILEYAWDMNWCDPCAADPLSQAQLRELGAFWIGREGEPRIGANGQLIAPKPRPGGQARDAFVTRLHVRYDAASFPEDLKFQETGDRQNFQGRYVMRNPFKGDLNCPAGAQYARDLENRFEKEATQLASLTGWDVSEIRQKMRDTGQTPPAAPEVETKPWWEDIWKK